MVTFPTFTGLVLRRLMVVSKMGRSVVVSDVVGVGRVCITLLGKFAVAKISDCNVSVSQIATAWAFLDDEVAKKKIKSEVINLILGNMRFIFLNLGSDRQLN